MTNKINGIDVSEYFVNHYDDSGKLYAVEYKGNPLELQNAIKRLQNENEELKELKCKFKEYCTCDTERLQEENEKIKNQYNCYACGNCNGKEDYINLEKHHKGLRKQFDELVKRNNTLSLRIEELEKENEKLEKKNKELLNLSNRGGALLVAESTKNKKYKQALEEIRKEYTNSIFYQCDKTEEECPCHNCIILGQLDRVQNIVKIIDEVLDDRN